MTRERWARLEAIFDRAIALPAAGREAFVRASAGEESLAREALDLIAAHEADHPLLDAPAAHQLPEGMRIGPYAIERVLGSGGMGVVYLASRADGQFQKQVAIKLLTAGLHAAFDQRHLRVEREALARLDHPHIARLLDSGYNSFGQPYLVMEYVEGEPLHVWRLQQQPSSQAAIELWLKVASAVAEAHRNLIVHRDLKPANILVDRHGEPRLLDFGVAKLLGESNAEATRTQYYTANYASPEQRSGAAITTGSDIYSLGVVLHELLTGELPPGNALRGDLAAVVAMALREEPHRRYATVDRFAEDVRRSLKGLPVSARPDSLAYRTGRFLGRHKIAAALVLVACTVIVAAASVAVIQARRAEQVTQYLKSMLGGSATDPDSLVRERGAAVKLSELLEQLDRRISAHPPAPEVEFELRHVIGLDYYQMGLYDQARNSLARSRQLADRLYPANHPSRHDMNLVRGALELAVGRFAEAEQILRHLRTQWRNPPPHSLAVLCANLGTAELRLGHRRRAEATFQQGLLADPSNPLLLSNSSLVFIEQGRFTEAIARLEKAAASSRAAHREPRVPLAWTLANLGLIYLWTGQHEAARRNAAESLGLFEATLGRDHPATIHPIMTLAHVTSARNPSQAEALMRRGVAAQAAALDEGHFERAVGLTHLGFVLMRGANPQEAVKPLRLALALRKKTFQPPNWRIAETEGFLGEALARTGRRVEAKPLLESSAAGFAEVYGTTNPRTQDALARLQHWGR
ncbi:MAG: protein kinase [Bryobacterales bacterium]|nr:protein kinase [Bryobacterales bacterium]